MEEPAETISTIIGSLSDPRPRQQVHPRLRCRLRQRRHSDHQDAGASAEGERDRRTLHPNHPAECLDWLLIVNRRHLERVLRVFADHYNSHRPHRSLDLKPPDPLARQLQIPHSPTALVERRDRLGGLIHEYRAAA